MLIEALLLELFIGPLHSSDLMNNQMNPYLNQNKIIYLNNGSPSRVEPVSDADKSQHDSNCP